MGFSFFPRWSVEPPKMGLCEIPNCWIRFLDYNVSNPNVDWIGPLRLCFRKSEISCVWVDFSHMYGLTPSTHNCPLLILIILHPTRGSSQPLELPLTVAQHVRLVKHDEIDPDYHACCLYPHLIPIHSKKRSPI